MEIEPLESRRMLSATHTPSVVADGANTFSEAPSLGTLAGPLVVKNALSRREPGDFLRFTVRSLGNVNLALSGLSANANLRLLNARGKLVASAERPGTRTETVSKKLKPGTYTVAVDRARRAANTPYTLALQADDNFETVAIDGKTYTLGITPAGGSTAPISTIRETWVSIHGWRSTPEDMRSVATAIGESSDEVQVLDLNWSTVAANRDLVSVALRVDQVAAWAAEKLREWNIPSSNLNLVGHSLGGYMTDELARRVAGGVDRIVALDPATVSLGGWDFSGTNFAAHSRY
jgi:hypothetical protein